MNEHRIEAAAFAIYREFARHGVGTCIILNINGKQVPETPEQACVRRWRQLPAATKQSFLREATAALQTAEDFS